MTGANHQSKILMLISSPFQYWCALEYLYQMEQRASITVVNAATFCENSMLQIEAMHKFAKPESVTLLTIPKEGSLERRIEAYSDLITLFASDAFSTVLIGDLRQLWMQDIACNINADNVVLVDDGAATNVFEKFIIRPSDYMLPVSMHSENAERKALAWELKSSLGILYKPTKFRLFSIFGFGHSKYAIGNKLLLLRQQFKMHAQNANPEWHFIGSPVCEKGLLDAKRYYDILAHAAKYHHADSSLIYFAHRAEDMNSKAQLLSDLGYRIEFHDQPYELACASQGRMPEKVVGLHSTSLFNMKILSCNECEAICYLLNENELAAMSKRNYGSDRFTLRDHIESIYDRFEEFGITTLNLQ
jgi:hypothetical protein